MKTQIRQMLMLKESLIRDISSNKTSVQFMKYLITGLLSAGLDFLILYWLRESVFPKHFYLNFGSNQVVLKSIYFSKTIGFVTVFWFNFLVNKFWSFNSRENLGRQVLLYSLLCLINLFISISLMYLLVNLIGLHYLAANLFCIGVIAIWNFVIYKQIIYR